MSGSSWSVVESKKRPAKKTANMEPLSVPALDWRDEFIETDRRIYSLLKKSFPKGLTAQVIANKVNAKRREGADVPIITASDVGDMFYGDKDDVSDEMMPYVVPVDPDERPRRWRLRSTTDP